MRLAPGKIFAGKFVLEKHFASGGMGAVWRARDTQRNLPVAIKVMSAMVADSHRFTVRFEREALAVSRIGSPNVVNIYEYGVHGKTPYMVMELLEGEDLQTRLKREGRLSPRATLRFVRGVCEALHAAHEMNIIHRDLKPANIFLVRTGDTESAKVLDFGIAKLAQEEEENSSITATGQMMGTPHYMSPEQILGAKHVDHRADLWAISAIAFRALTGELPYTGHTVQVIRAILDEPAPPPSSVFPDLSPAVDAFFDRALARDITARFQTARDLSAALAKALGREGMQSRTGPISGAPGQALTGAGEPQPGVRITEMHDSDAPPSERFRPSLPVDAELLPVQLRDSAPPSLPTPTTPITPIPESLPVVAPRRRRSWIVWAAAVATIVIVVVIAVLATTTGAVDPSR